MGEQQIKKLSEREKCRDKIAVFYGSRDNYYHGFLETLMNSNDELKNYFDNGTIEITVEEDLQTISVFDTGRGIPLMGETDGTPNYILLFETTFAGTNYDNLELGKTTTGTNGCGSCVLNQTSTIYEATCYKNNKMYKVEYKDGELQKYIDGEHSDIEHGTLIKFKLDDTVYTNTTYNIEEIKSILNRVASTNTKISIILHYNGEDFTYHYDSIEQYMNSNITNKLSKVFNFNPKTYETKVKKEDKELNELNTITSSISLSAEPFQETYLNSTYLKENGSIYDGIIEGIKKFLQKDVKSKTKLSNQDISMSFNIYCSFESTNVEFMNQTKFSTNKLLYKKLATQYIQENLEILKNEDKNTYNKFIEHVEKVNNLNVKSEDTIKRFKDKLGGKTNGLSRKINGMKECDMRHSEMEERIFIVDEGLSANATIIDAFDNRYMGCLGLRGRFINSLKSSVKDVLNNEPALGIIQALGCGIEIPEEEKKLYKGFESFDINNLRYGTLAIICDQDSFGKGIALAIITFVKKFMPQLLKEGRVCYVISPRYEIRDKKKKSYYAYNENEKTKIIEKLGSNFYDVSIRKGLTTTN